MRKYEKVLLILGFFITVAASSALTAYLTAPRTAAAHQYGDLEWRINELEDKVDDLEMSLEALKLRVLNLE